MENHNSRVTHTDKSFQSWNKSDTHYRMVLNRVEVNYCQKNVIMNNDTETNLVISEDLIKIFR